MNPVNLLPNVHALGFKVGQWLVRFWLLLAQQTFLNRDAVSSATNSYTDDEVGVSSRTCSILNQPNSAFCVQRLPLPQQLWHMIVTFPVWYREWWWNLMQNDPTHVFVETTLLLAIVYFLLSRRSLPNYKESQGSRLDRLTTQEEDELIQQWKRQERKPLTPANGNSNPNSNTYRRTVIVHKANGRFMDVEEITSDEIPSSASKDTTTNDPNRPNAIQTVLNFATFDFLGMAADTLPSVESVNDENSMESSSTKSGKASKRSPSMESVSSSNTSKPQPLHPVKVASLAALDRYGCGSCGPRGFYGTIDVHLQLEESISAFLSTDDAILYSDGASTVSSTVAAFCKRGDVLVVDEAVYEPIRTGAQLSRANIKWFAHNDMKDLRRVLLSIQQADLKLGRKSNAQRRFIVVEGLYKNTGTICPLDELIALKHEFKYRLILDESFSFGVLGSTGRGATELYQKKLMHDVEITCVSMENALGSIGGITTGTEEVVDHQRLSGSGYCYSASSPPFTASAAIAALNLLQTRPEITLHQLQTNQAYLYNKLQILVHEKLEDLLLITSDVRSPIVMLQVADIPETEYLDEVVFLQEVVRESLLRGVALVATAPSPHNSSSQLAAASADPPSGIRLTVSALHTLADIDKAVDVLGEAVDVVMGRFHEEEAAIQ
jgi:serine palmitoyltransferase